MTARLVLRVLLRLAPLAVGVALLTQPAAAAAAGPISWSTPEAIDSGNAIYAVSCPSNSLCVAVDSAGNVLWSTDPAGGASTWQKTTLTGAGMLESISCPSVSLCVAGGGFGGTPPGNGTIAVSTDPTGGAGQWKVEVMPPSGSLDTLDIWGGFGNGIACATGPVCVAIDQFTPDLISTATPAVADSWSSGNIDVASGVSCPSASLCVLVTASPGNPGGGDAFFSTNPDSGSWTETAGIDSAGPMITEGQLNAVSCPTTTLCVATDQNGYVVSTTAPTGPSSGWHVTPAIVSTSQLLHVSCAPRPTLRRP